MDFVATSADPARPLPSISLDPPPRRAVIPPDPFPPTLGAARARIAAVRPSEYARTRNAIDGAVTRLSPYVTHGFVSLPEVLAGVAARHRVDPQHKLVFELGWREWFRHVWTHEGDGLLESLHEGPLPDRAYARELPDDVRRARTGVPVVDQAVRALYATGYLHNHARMWLASYLVHLRKVHWRAGADWMLGHLLDGDLASNHLSWQWVAGSGADAAPYFRVFNPVLQGEKFDPDGAYVAKWVPELAQLPHKLIHQPWEATPMELATAGVTLGKTYPEPIVDHKAARARALAAYAKTRGS